MLENWDLNPGHALGWEHVTTTTYWFALGWESNHHNILISILLTSTEKDTGVTSLGCLPDIFLVFTNIGKPIKISSKLCVLYVNRMVPKMWSFLTGITWKLVQVQIPRPDPRPTESVTPGLGPATCVSSSSSGDLRARWSLRTTALITRNAYSRK